VDVRSDTHQVQVQNTGINLAIIMDTAGINDSHVIGSTAFAETKGQEPDTSYIQQRYNLLKQAYEERIEQLSQVVHNTCAKLLSDEVFIELKGDRTSAAFVPSHLSEVISASLHGEREEYIHELLQKINTYENDKHITNTMVASLKDQNVGLLARLAISERSISSLSPAADTLQQAQLRHADYEKETRQTLITLQQEVDAWRLRERQLVNKLEISQQELEDKAQLCNHLHSQLVARERDLGTLEQSFDEASRALALVESMEMQEQMHKDELKELVTALTDERNALHDENQQLRAKMQYACDELDRCHAVVAQKDADEVSNKQRLSEMMEQVESVLVQEAADSNAAINSVHDKMKAFRQRMSAELQKEKRLTATLQEELHTARAVKEEALRDQQHLLQQDSALREQLHAEQERNVALTRQLQEQAHQAASWKAKAAELQPIAAKADQVDRDYERLRSLEAQLVAERAALLSDKGRESEQHQIEKRMEAYKLHHENELTELRKQLKNAYAFDKNGKTATEASEVSYKNTIQSWVQENARLKQRHSAELAVVATRLKGEYENLVSQLQLHLEQASANMDKLKAMVRSGRVQSRTLQERMDALNKENLALKLQLQASHNEMPPSAPAWNTSANTSITKRDRAASASTRTRRSSLSSADVSREVEHHRAEVLHRVLKSPDVPAPAGNDSTAGGVAGSPTPAQRRLSSSVVVSGSQPVAPTTVASRRSSTSALGTSRLASPTGSVQSQPTTPNSALAEVTRQELNKAREDASTARLAERRASEELARVSGQNERLLREIRECESQNEALQSQLASRPVDKPWEETANKSILEAKLREIAALREQMEGMQRSASGAAQEKDAEHSALRRALDELQSKHAELVAKKTSTAPIPCEEGSTVFSDGSSSRDSDAPSELNDTENGKSLGSVMRRLDASQYEASMVQMEESLQHQIELSRICSDELQQERQRVREVRMREVKLFQLVGQVERAYRGQIHGLRKDLQEVRSIAQALASAAQVEVRSTVSSLALQLDHLFRQKDKSAQEDIRRAHIELSNAHSQEMNLLEARFVEQLGLQAAAHRLEMDHQHTELVMRAESALGLTLLSDSASVDDSLNEGVSGLPSSRSHPRSVSFASETSDLRSLASATKQRRHTTLNSAPATRRSEKSTPLPAYESVATGVLEALKDEEIIDSGGAQQILALAKAHQEPSFAAQAAAKSLVAGCVERFVNAQHERIHRAMTNGNGKATQRIHTGGADYSVFFD
jgi:hypothetical protein